MAAERTPASLLVFKHALSRWALFAHDNDSEDYILRQLLELGYIKLASSRAPKYRQIKSFTIEAQGWKRLQFLQNNASIFDQAFVAMWFDPEMQNFYDAGIQPAVTGAGYRCLRIDLKEHNNQICDEMVAEIRRSRFLVADFTGNRGGVYWEAGFAHGLGLPVILTVREDHLKDVHFDTRQYSHVVYSTPVELKAKLEARIRATIV
jgi:nucleoside 2-deoxyribosyltransferase